MDYWPDPENPNEAILVWGDTGGCINALHFLSASIALFERPPAPAGEKQGKNNITEYKYGGSYLTQTCILKTILPLTNILLSYKHILSMT